MMDWTGELFKSVIQILIYSSHVRLAIPALTCTASPQKNVIWKVYAVLRYTHNDEFKLKLKLYEFSWVELSDVSSA